MSLTLQYVPTHFAAQTWPQVEGYMAAAEKFGLGDHTLEQMKMQVLTGNWSMVAAVDGGCEIKGAFLMSFVNHPNSRVGFITCAGGEGISDPDVIDQLYKYSESMGATKLQACARPAIVRLLRKSGFEQVTSVVELKR